MSMSTDAAAETAVLLHFLTPGPISATPAALYAAIRERGVTPTHLDAAITSLVSAGLLTRTGDVVRRTDALGRMETLGLVKL
jgi:DNA-binding MarR family transcriptional regulator